eukprot:CAMPEP_0175175768 /NCGR_PEP_ID=MMETSP0087-20121206/33392_1 /TAXON_ID=136419 /ORGANISM="Unknown Unknown, Strain D1" /LENGTH=206 /DNA_ID=CAMNT_0016467427 /DNA_START=236 /DNA_END=853 /DNA_ORIENTATION=+
MNFLDPSSTKTVLVPSDLTPATCVASLTCCIRTSKPPLFVIEAITDSVVMCGFEGLDCTPKGLISKAVWGYINQYGHNATKNFAQINPKRDGLFAPSCLLHTGFLVDKPLLANMSAGQALFAWAQQYMPRQAGQVEPSEQDKGGTGRVPGLEGPFIFMAPAAPMSSCLPATITAHPSPNLSPEHAALPNLAARPPTSTTTPGPSLP